MDAIHSYLIRSSDADMAFSYFEDFIKNSTAKSTVFELLKSFKVVGELLFDIFSQSNTVSTYLINNPQKMFWLIENETLANFKTRDDFYKEAFSVICKTDGTDRREYRLRQYRKNEYLRIVAREIIKACSFEDIMKELSHLASALIEAALWIAKEKLKESYQISDCNIAVIGMGKLGNAELNFSSDIDLLFVHGNEENGEYCNRLAGKVVSILNDNKNGGFVYRVDMRLRPGGKMAALSLSLDEYENYYSTFGQLWEKMALTKAYPIAGNIDLGYDFLRTVEPFVYRKSMDLEYIKEIRSLIFKIKKYSKKTSEDSFIPFDKIDVKKGRGGIREIEFTLNYFQLIYGGKDRELRHTGTIDGLKILKKKGYLDKASCDTLTEAYLFLRKIEHKIQLVDEQQTQKLPSDKNELEKLAKKLGIDLDEFVNKYMILTDEVHSVFNSIFIRDDKFPALSAMDDVEGFLYESGIEAAQSVAAVVKSAVKKFLAKEIKRTLIEDIFDFAFRFVKKDLFENCMKGFNMIDPTYVVLMFENRELFKAFLKMLCVDLSNKLSQNMNLFEYFIGSGDEKKFGFSRKDYEKMVLISVFDLFLNPFHFDMKKFSSYTIEFVRHVAKKYDKDGNISIVGYGKLSTGELFIESDLDLVFVAKKNAYLYVDTVQKIVKELKQLYDVDLRLRPYGDKGSIVVDIEYLKRYFKNNACAWEKQAAQKSKVIYSGFGESELKDIYNSFVIKNPPSKNDILDMKNKIERTKGKKYNIKSFEGGISDIEFLAQALCFENNCIEIGKSCLELLELIKKRSLLNTSRLREAYIFYTAVLNIHRTFSKGSIIKDFGTVEFFMGQKGVKEEIEKHRTYVKTVFREVFV